MAMTDYPEDSDFLEPEKAYPVTVACRSIKGKPTSLPGHSSPLSPLQIDSLAYLKKASDAYLNDKYDDGYCNKWKQTDSTGNLGDGHGWDALACNQVVLPMSSNGSGMFWDEGDFDYPGYTKMCQDTFGLTPQYDWALQFFGGADINTEWKDMTNIVWSNGSLDPWSAGGVTKNVPGWSKDGGKTWATEAILIENSAHHTDLREPKDADPQTLKDARAKELAHIQKWIQEYAETRPTFPTKK